MENKESTHPSNGEFDMLSGIASFFLACKKGFIQLGKWLGKAFVWGFNLHIRYFFLFLVFLIALLFWFRSQRDTEDRCSGNATLYCNGFDNYTFDQIVGKLNTAIAQKNTAYLSRTLNISPEDASRLYAIFMGVGIDLDQNGIPNTFRFSNKFEADRYTKGQVLKSKQKGEILERIPRDVKIPDMAALEFTTRGNNTGFFLKMADTVLHYLNHHPDLQKLYRSYITGLEYTCRNYDRQIALLDSLTKIEYVENARKQKTAPQKDLYMAGILTSNKDLAVEDITRMAAQHTFYYEEILPLTQERAKLQQRYELAVSPLTVISGFAPSISHYHSYLWLLRPIFLSILITLILGSLWDHRKQVRAYIKEQRRPGAN
ncbi:MAG: hypothetical protein K2L50_02605 [Bacteroidales bacterium]|nr:hypothetical protein [Bacteroidales bacterium]